MRHKLSSFIRPQPHPLPLPEPLSDLLPEGLNPCLLEIFGVPGTCKTQTLLATAAYVLSETTASVLIIDADGTTAQHRLTEILCTLVSDKEELDNAFERVRIIRIARWDEIVLLSHMLPTVVKHMPNMRLLCIDGLATLFRTCTQTAVSKRLEALAIRLHGFAIEHDTAVVLTNTARTEGGVIQPSMGEQWRFVASKRIHATHFSSDAKKLTLTKEIGIPARPVYVTPSKYGISSHGAESQSQYTPQDVTGRPEFDGTYTQS